MNRLRLITQKISTTTTTTLFAQKRLGLSLAVSAKKVVLDFCHGT
jgi:hypothetical protein